MQESHGATLVTSDSPLEQGKSQRNTTLRHVGIKELDLYSRVQQDLQIDEEIMIPTLELSRFHDCDRPVP